MKKPKMVLLKVEDIATDSLEPSRVQPPWRTADGPALRDLAGDIERNGLANPPIVARIGKRFVLIDGHRRLAACILLGFESIKCRVFSAANVAEAEARFASINRPTRRLTARDALYGWANATDRTAFLAEVPNGQAVAIRQFAKLFGDTRATELGKAGAEPSVANRVQLACRVLALYGQVPSASSIGEWILKHHGSHTVLCVATLGRKREAAKLREAIVKDLPYTLSTKLRRRAA